MELARYENLGSIDRTIRVYIGLALAMTPLFIDEYVEIITATVFASIYPLMTGLLAFDPLLSMVEKFKWKSVSFRNPILH